MTIDIHGYKVELDIHEAQMSFTATRENSCSIEGTIKWDGCSNWDFQADGVQAHFCGLEDVANFNAFMVELYRLAGEHIVRWDAELAC